MKAVVLLSWMLVVVGCGQKSNFSGDSHQSNGTNNPNDPNNPNAGNNPNGPGGDPTNPGGNGNTPGGGTTDTVPTPQCTNRDSLKAAHFVFLIDNSNSQHETDCPRALFNDCGKTEREKSVLAAFDTLVKLAAMPGDVKSSTVSVTRFTPGTESEDGPATEMLPPTTLANGNRSRLESALRFTRNPIGGTPFMGTVTGTQTWVGKIPNDGRPRVAVIVTDGEPTDINPGDVLAKANALRSSGVRFITIKITQGYTNEQRVQRHRSIMTDIFDQRNAAGNKSPYSSFDEYFNALIALPGGISSEILSVDQATGLTDKISKDIIQKETKCI